MKPQANSNFLYEFRRLLNLAYPERRTIASLHFSFLAGVSFLMISSGITMSMPFVIGQIIDILKPVDGHADSKVIDGQSKKQFIKALCSSSRRVCHWRSV
jgi:hypothetical protein